ncbi:MAG: DUF1616 domain-containing protein [Peptococcaceae bacterium]|nr:MAG: DUF1616 domain-containing protein [Peptococcaceae bacterium]
MALPVGGALRVILGLPYVLFFPGYCLIAALFPAKNDLDGIERAALSFGLSIAVTPLIGLVLNYTSWGIRLVPIFISLFFFIAVMSAVAWYRRRKLPAGEDYFPVLEVNLPRWSELTGVDRVFSVALVMAVLFATGSIYYVVAAPKVGEKFTEFYILGLGGKVEGYPGEIKAGEKGEVIAGIVNHEYEPKKYFVEIKVDGERPERLGPVELAHGQKWEEQLSFYSARPQENAKVEFLLYREGDTEPYRSLHLWVAVLPAQDMGGSGP